MGRTALTSRLRLAVFLLAMLAAITAGYAQAALFGGGRFDTEDETTFVRTWNANYKKASADEQQALVKALARALNPRQSMTQDTMEAPLSLETLDQSYEEAIKAINPADIQFQAEGLVYAGNKAAFTDKTTAETIRAHDLEEQKYLQDALPKLKTRIDGILAALGQGVPVQAQTPTDSAAIATALAAYPISNVSLTPATDYKAWLKVTVANTGTQPVEQIKLRLKLAKKGEDTPRVDEVVTYDIPGGIAPGAARDLSIDVGVHYWLYAKAIFRTEAEAMLPASASRYDYEVTLDDILTPEGSVISRAQTTNIQQRAAAGFAHNRAVFDSEVKDMKDRAAIKALALAYLKLNADGRDVNKRLVASEGVTVLASPMELDALKSALTKNGILTEEEIRPYL